VFRRFRRALTTVAALAAVVAVGAACVPAGTPPAPFKDADNGTPADHGWFEGGKTWRGDFGDPSIVRVGSTYYAYSSSAGGRYLGVLTSTDLRTWTIHPRWSRAASPLVAGWQAGVPAELLTYADPEGAWGHFNNNDALVRPASWGLATRVNAWVDRTYWASSVFNIGSTWYAYSAVKVGTSSDDPHHYGRFCLTVASGPSPLGPFRDASGSAPIQCQSADHDPAGSIDPYPYHDPSTGKNYLLWKAAGKIGVRESALMSVELASNGKPLPGAKPTVLVTTNRSAPWEGSTIENPAMIAYRGTTYLFYSANDSIWTDTDGRSSYATGYAICPQGPRGACIRPGGGTRPLLASSGAKQGPGGASPVIDTAGQLRLAYATYWLGENRAGYHPRRLQITRLLQNGDRTLRVG
jgi:beta-xylosidase